ncbi:MAG: DUF4351 domain-containing protein [Lautropia sp.]
MRLLYERDWGRERIVALFNVLDWMLVLPESLEDRLWQDIEAIEGGQDRRYISSVEKIGMRRGMAKGLEKGLEKGRELLLLTQLTHRFGALPEAVAARVEAGSAAEVERWARRILDARTLDEVFAEVFQSKTND